jgi:hypothetical protein
MNLFNRGGDPRHAIGVGQIESLKIKIKDLENQKAVDAMYTEKGTYIRDTKAHQGIILNIMLNLSKTDDPRRPDKFLIKYLDPMFFEGMDVEEQGSSLKSISENLEDVIRTKTNIFGCHLYVKKEYEDIFPSVKYHVW